MQLARTRSLFFLAFLACASIMGATAYLAPMIAGEPCPLCDLQTFLMAVFAVGCLVAAANARLRLSGWVYPGFLAVIAMTGAAVAARQVWLQASPPESLASCLENLQYLLDTQPYLKMLFMVLAGSAGCSEVTWSFFGISMPELSVLAFTGMTLFALCSVFAGLRRFRSRDADEHD